MDEFTQEKIEFAAVREILSGFCASGPGKTLARRKGPSRNPETLGGGFSLIECLRETHQTPWDKPQAFVYCLFQDVG